MSNHAIWVCPTNLSTFLHELLPLLAGNAVISIETNSSSFIVNENLCCPPPAYVKPEAKGLMTMFCMPLEASNAHHVCESMTQNPNWEKAIVFMQIHKNGERIFLSGDGFDDECISFWSAHRFELVNQCIKKKMVTLLPRTQ